MKVKLKEIQGCNQIFTLKDDSTLRFEPNEEIIIDRDNYSDDIIVALEREYILELGEVKDEEKVQEEKKNKKVKEKGDE